MTDEIPGSFLNFLDAFTKYQRVKARYDLEFTRAAENYRGYLVPTDELHEAKEECWALFQKAAQEAVGIKPADPMEV